MTIKTNKVQGRRQLSFAVLDDVVADAEKLVASPNMKTLGNLPLSQLLGHVSAVMNLSIDGIGFKAPWFIRLLGPLFKKRFLTRPMPAGFNLPRKAEASFFPAVASSPQEALQNLRRAVARSHNEKMSAKHPVLGKLTHEEWTQLHLRHCELHLSFAVPG